MQKKRNIIFVVDVWLYRVFHYVASINIVLNCLRTSTEGGIEDYLFQIVIRVGRHSGEGAMLELFEAQVEF